VVYQRKRLGKVLGAKAFEQEGLARGLEVFGEAHGVEVEVADAPDPGRDLVQDGVQQRAGCDQVQFGQLLVEVADRLDGRQGLLDLVEEQKRAAGLDSLSGNGRQLLDDLTGVELAFEQLRQLGLLLEVELYEGLVGFSVLANQPGLADLAGSFYQQGLPAWPVFPGIQRL